MSARALALLLALVALLATSAAPAAAYEDPAGCPTETTFDPAVPTFDAIVGRPLGEGGTGSTPRNLSQKLYDYFDAMVAYTADHPRVKVIRKDFGFSVLGKPLRFYVVSSRDNVENLDTGRADGKFWEGVKDGSISEADAVAAAPHRPALGWVTATPHGNEPAAGEAISRLLYELVARTDCWNLRRLHDMDLFLMPVRNPDGRDAPPGGVRTSAWAFDHNRDFGTQNQAENATFLPLLKRYPGLFFIDAHQQSTGYFFPPNEDPVLHEISNFSLDFIQNKIGPALQQKFNDQSTSYRNYNTYDLFVPEYGDSVPTLLSGAAGMTFEKGTSEIYGKQVYDHYLAIDETINVTVRDKTNILRAWAEQWQEAVDQGAACTLQPNKLVSPLRPVIEREVPADLRICGYFYRPGEHAGDAAELIRHMQRQGVHVYRFDTDAALPGVREFGTDGGVTQTLPAGTLYIPMEQPLKHWIQAVLGEDPFQPLNLFYDVAQWSYSLQRGMSGNGYLTERPLNVPMTEVADPDMGSLAGAGAPVYAFDTDSMRGLALVLELLDAGATVYRARDSFPAAGREFRTGAALVDASTLGSFDLAARAEARQTPVVGLDGYPAARYELAEPKIGLYSNAYVNPPTNSPVGTAGTEPQVFNNPLNPNPAAPLPGHCGSQPAGVGAGTTFCQALFTLTQKIGIPASMVVPIHTGQILDGDLVDEEFTALINPGQVIGPPVRTLTPTPNNPSQVSTVATPAGQEQLQEFVNEGGIYVGQLVGGTTAARSAGITTLNTQSIAGLLSTPGSFFSASFDTTNPVAWGFDRGGWIYRESTGDPVYDPATLEGDGESIGPATAAVSYSEPLKTFGYAANALGAGQLPGRPAVVDQPFGAGHAIMLGFDAFFRAWREQDERLVLNAVLYPSGTLVPAQGRTVTQADPPLPGQPAADRPARPVADRALPATGNRPVRAVDRTARDVRIKVARKDAAKLRRAVRKARLSKALRRRSRWVTTRRTVTFVVRRARTGANDHDRGAWVGRIVTPLRRQGVRIVSGQL